MRGLLCDGALYGEALAELERQFGNPSHVVRANLHAVLCLEPVGSEDDLAALSALSSALHCTVKVLQTMHYDADLAATQNVRQVISKLPRGIAWRWREHCVRARLSVPTLADLDHWLRDFIDAGRAVCDLNGEQPHKSSEKNSSRRHQSNENRRNSRPQPDPAMGQWRSSLAVTSAAASSTQPETTPTCAHCKAAHAVPHCTEFTALSLSERAAAVRQHGLCWVCLCDGHVARQCPSRQRCTTAPDCTGWHHPLPHGAPRVFPSQATAAAVQTRNGPSIVSTTAEEDGSKILLQILPLRVSGPSGQRTVNVMLDLGSQVTLIAEQLARDLGLPGPAEKLSLGIVDGSRSYPSRRVEFSLQPKGTSQKFHDSGARTTPVLNVSGPAVNWPSTKQQ